MWDLQLPSQGFLHRLRNLANTWLRDIYFSWFSAALGGHEKHKRIRRGKRGKSKTVGKYTNQFCNIYYANVNDFRSKSESIKQLIQVNGIDILVLIET